MPHPVLSKKQSSQGKSQRKEEGGKPGDKPGVSANAAPATPAAAFTDYVYEEPSQFRKSFYDFMLWLLWNIFECFFREIRSRGGFKVPGDCPVIFVAAPHANQFVDPIILMEQVRKAIDKRVSFLIAESSLHVRSIGFLARSVMSIGVVRPQDNLAPATGRIRIDPDDYTRVIGIGTKFLSECKPKGLLGLPKSMGNVEIQSVESDTVLYLRRELKSMSKPEVQRILVHSSRGSTFKYAAKVDQSLVYHKVFEHLAHNNCIGIFPEGGSHDRTDLLPLKAGVAIMALGCLDKHPQSRVKIVPCGMNYFHAHKFRSRAVVEFGDPIEIGPELVEMYRNPDTNREAVKTLLDEITRGLKSVTVTCRDYETLMIVQAMRRLYSTQFQRQLPLSLIVDMNRRIVKGFESHRDEPEVKQLGQDILRYNEHLKYYNVPDHCVSSARVDFMTNLCLLVYRCVFITVALALALPGILMFSPIFLLSNHISKKKARTALAKSSVKIKANDVIATWKILMGMGFAPLLYILWSTIITYVVVARKRYTSHWICVYFITYALCVIVTYSALIVGDRGMDTLKSLRPLYLSLTSPSGLKKLQREREELTQRIVTMMNVFGADVHPDFDSESFAKEYRSDDVLQERKNTEIRRRKLLRRKRERKNAEEESELSSMHEVESELTGADSDAVSLVNSDNSLSNIPLFSSIGRTSRASSTVSTQPSSSAVSAGEATSESEFELGMGEEASAAKTSALSSKIAQAVLNQRAGERVEREQHEQHDN